jgi:hypothetical protein
LAALDPLNPIGRLAASEVAALLVEEKNVDVLIFADAADISPKTFGPSAFISLDGVVQEFLLLRFDACGFPGRTQSQGYKNCGHQKQCERHPIREENLEK